MAKTIAISNQKGGVAKTTTSVSLGACFAELGHPTLLIDLDPQASLSVAVGFHEDNSETTITDLLETQLNPKPLDRSDLIKKTTFPGLDVILSDARLWTVERLLSDQLDYEKILKRELEQVAAQYEYIILDCSPSLGPLTIMALTASEHVIVPIQTEYLAAFGLMRLLETIDAIHEHTNPELSYNLLAVLFDQRTAICREVLDRLKDNFKDHIFETVIGIDTRLRECVVNGEPIIQYDTKTRASQQYRQLALEYIQKTELREKS
jgi:chromosome partitioning protein